MVIIKSCFKITGSSSMSLYSSEEHTVLTGMLLILKTSINQYSIMGKILFCINSSEFILFFFGFLLWGACFSFRNVKFDCITYIILMCSTFSQCLSPAGIESQKRKGNTWP